MKKPFEGKYGPLLIAEIGGNHEGNFDYAKKLTELAITAGVDYVKFQIYTGDALVSSVESPDRNKHFKRFELTKEQHRYLASMVVDAGIGYTSSVWDIESITWIDEYMSIYKIGSGDLTAYPVISNVAKRGKPIILSTGLATEKEVIETIDFIQSVNPVYKNSEMLAVLQCTSMYPIGNSEANLRVIPRLKELTKLTIGYSDHTEGSKALCYATAMGAEILEFHFTDSRNGKEFRDHKVSLTPGEIEALIEEIKLIRQLQGDAIKRPIAIEIENGHDVSFRRAVYPSQDIQKGELLTEENLTILRPNHGIDARQFYTLLGKRAGQALKKHHVLSFNMLEKS